MYVPSLPYKPQRALADGEHAMKYGLRNPGLPYVNGIPSSSKTIPPAAFDRMFSSFEKVSDEEGFDEVINVDNREMIKQLAGEESV